MLDGQGFDVLHIIFTRTVFYSQKVEINSSTKHAHSSTGTLMYMIRALGSDLVKAERERERDTAICELMPRRRQSKSRPTVDYLHLDNSLGQGHKRMSFG